MEAKSSVLLRMKLLVIFPSHTAVDNSHIPRVLLLFTVLVSLDDIGAWVWLLTFRVTVQFVTHSETTLKEKEGLWLENYII